VRSAIVTLPERASAVFGWMLKTTWPAPLPVEPPAMPIHDARLAAVQLQPLMASTWIVAEPPLADSDRELTSTLNLHGAPSCVMSTWADPTAMPPRRKAGVLLAVTAYAIAAVP